MKKIEIRNNAVEFESAQELPEQFTTLVLKAREAAQNAYSPYSGFKVGAAVLLDNGKIILGNNQENAAYPSGLCAERVAVFAAAANYPKAIVKAIAITAASDKFIVNTPVSPCGACRQVLAEYEYKSKSDITVLLSGVQGKVLQIDNIKTLLPFVFDASELFNKKDKK